MLCWRCWDIERRFLKFKSGFLRNGCRNVHFIVSLQTSRVASSFWSLKLRKRGIPFGGCKERVRPREGRAFSKWKMVRKRRTRLWRSSGQTIFERRYGVSFWRWVRLPRTAYEKSPAGIFEPQYNSHPGLATRPLRALTQFLGFTFLRIYQVIVDNFNIECVYFFWNIPYKWW